MCKFYIIIYRKVRIEENAKKTYHRKVFRLSYYLSYYIEFNSLKTKTSIMS